jgi:transposase
MMKVKMKISGAFRTFKGAVDFAALRSVVATARKQGWNILQTLTANPYTLSLSLSLSLTQPWPLRPSLQKRQFWINNIRQL